jgi:hypothetical protein
MRNEQLNNTCIIFDPKDEAQQKAIIKFYNDNGWPYSMGSYMERGDSTDCIGVLDRDLGYWWQNELPMRIIELPSDYYPTKIVESESKDVFYQIDFGNHLRCQIKVVDNKIEVEGAINGWGDNVPDAEIIISRK